MPETRDREEGDSVPRSRHRVPWRPPRRQSNALLAEGVEARVRRQRAPRLGRDPTFPGAGSARNNSTSARWLAACRSVNSRASARPSSWPLLGGEAANGDGLLSQVEEPRRQTYVKVVVRSGFDEMNASPWEKEGRDPTRASPSTNYSRCRRPIPPTMTGGTLTGVHVREGRRRRGNAKAPATVSEGEPDVHLLRRRAVAIRPGKAFRGSSANRHVGLRRLGPA